MKFSLVRRLAAITLLFFMTAGYSFAADPNVNVKLAGDSVGSGGVKVNEFLRGIDASADVFEYVGDNMIARGHVVIITKTMTLKADHAVIHVPSRDLEAFGNVSLVRRTSTRKTVDQQEYQDLLDDIRKYVEVEDVTVSPLGRKKFQVKITETTAHIQAERLAGNLDSGELRFQNFAMKSGALYAVAGLAHRKTTGEIVAENTRLTTCEYVMDDHDHYAFTASKAYITPRSYESGLHNYNTDHSDQSILLVNSFLRFWDVPLLWLPALYKPRETDTFGVDLAVGYNSDWGYWIRTSKNFDLQKDPYINTGVLLDYYTERGLGGGLTSTIVTGNSRTEFFAYAIRDRNPYLFRDIDDDDDKKIVKFQNEYRIEIPKNRYDIKLTNVTHITPRLDFRGQVEFISDTDILKDFFEDRYDNDPQPPSYAALEYQADWASFSLLTTVKVNSFDSVMQRLPEARFDIFRQELFGGLYYQSENSFGYLSNRWRDFEHDTASYREWKRKFNGNKDKFLPDNYSSGRFDSLHMFYYPLMLDYINIVPRAGIRLTAYTSVSENEVTDDDLNTMFGVNSLYGKWAPINNFDVKNSSKLRFMSEFGVEANTKIYRTWQNARSAWLGLDGLRHVVVPYLNYTFIPKPTLNSEKILYFDDIDRLQEQNFIRFGLINKLQTRTGYYGNERIRQWASLETYWDFHAKRSSGFNHIGDFGIKMSLTPWQNFSLSSELILDMGGNNGDGYYIERGNNRKVRNPGLGSWKYLNAWRTSLNYKISDDWSVHFSYDYSARYWRRSIYSMGTMLDSLSATSTSLKVLETPTQSFNFSVAFPTYIDKRLKGNFYLEYDVNQALMEDIGIALVRDFHCFRAGVNVGLETDRNDRGKKDTSFYVSGFVALSSMPSTQFGAKK